MVPHLAEYPFSSTLKAPITTAADNIYKYFHCFSEKIRLDIFVCILILVMTFPEWLSGTEPLLHTRCRVSILVVFVVFCMHMHSFAGLIRQTPPPRFSGTAITDRHSDTTIFQLRAHWVWLSYSIGSEKSFGHVPPGGSQTLNFLCARQAPYPLGQALR